MQFDWLTIEWLMKNLDWISIVLVFTMLILFLFPVLLGVDLKKKAEKLENKNND
tara:strand:- start:6049 stop:6210 length:162 start_codon:yes stop_codon:yes gene_type:complete